MVVGGLCAVLSGCATIEAPQRANLASQDPQVRDCAAWFQLLDHLIGQNGVADRGARRVYGFPYLRTDRFTASFIDEVRAHESAFSGWIEHMRVLDADAREVEVANLPDSAADALGVCDRTAVLRRASRCGDRLQAADLVTADSTKVLFERARVADDYSSTKRTLGLYVLVRYVPRDTPLYSRDEVARLLHRSNQKVPDIPQLDAAERARLFATYAPVFEFETSGDFDRIGRLYWGQGDVALVDVDDPVVYRKLAYTRVAGRTLVQLVYVVWTAERPKSGLLDLLGGPLDGIVWRVTLAPDGEPLIFDSMHPCGGFHMFFSTPCVAPKEPPDKLVEWAYSPQVLPEIAQGERLALQAQARTHYLSRVAVDAGAGGRPYRFADYDDLRSLPTGQGQRRSIFRPDALIAGTQRGERYFYWPMGVASAGAMRQWGAHATAFVGRRHFDDPDLIEKRFRLLY